MSCATNTELEPAGKDAEKEGKDAAMLTHEEEVSRIEVEEARTVIEVEGLESENGEFEIVNLVRTNTLYGRLNISKARKSCCDLP